MQSKAKTVNEYLAELPKDRRAAISTVRKEILKRLPRGYEEAMNWGWTSSLRATTGQESADISHHP